MSAVSHDKIAARREQLQRGINALQVALVCLPLNAEQRAKLQSIIQDQKRLFPTLSPDKTTTLEPENPQQRIIQTTPLEKKAPLSKEEHARRSAEGQVRKQKRLEREKNLRLLEEKHHADIKELHRKSGFKSSWHRLPGSFEGGKK